MKGYLYVLRLGILGLDTEGFDGVLTPDFAFDCAFCASSFSFFRTSTNFLI